MSAEIPAFLLALGSAPAMIALAVFLATFILEDAATAGAALLAAEGVLSPSLALAALFAGIFLGDLVLFAIGHAARSSPWAHRLIGTERLDRGHQWLKQRYVVSLIAARFIPGMRLPTFAASGFLRMSFRTFFIVTLLAAFVWTTLVFTLIFMFGIAAANALGPWRWIAAALLLVAILTGPLLVRLIRQRGSRNHE